MPEMVWAILCRRESGCSRQQFLDLDDWTLVNVLGRPDANRGKPERGYWPVARDDPDNPVVAHDLGPRGVFFHPKKVEAMRALGYTDEEMEQEYKAWAAKLTFGGMPGG